jgi:hypothetical protein
VKSSDQLSKLDSVDVCREAALTNANSEVAFNVAQELSEDGNFRTITVGAVSRGEQASMNLRMERDKILGTE